MCFSINGTTWKPHHVKSNGKKNHIYLVREGKNKEMRTRRLQIATRLLFTLDRPEVSFSNVEFFMFLFSY